MTPEDARKLAGLKEQITLLTDDQRMEIFKDYCRSCGSDDPYCRCWDDE